MMADWPAPANVHALTTTRLGGVSVEPYQSLNLGERSGDNVDCVAENRQRLISCLPQAPLWLHQVHGTQVYELQAAQSINSDSVLPSPSFTPQADAISTRLRQQVCAVLTADCLPVLFCDQAGTRVAAAHAGWKGLLEGVLEQTVRSLACPPEHILAWMGPAITQAAFEVGPELRAAFIAKHAEAEHAFIAGKADRWHADLYALARLRLALLGVNQVFGEPVCTYANPQHFFSFRRDGTTGRMASLIWLD